MPRKTLDAAGVPPPAASASMRPRPDAAENMHHVRPASDGELRFNEAAARCRGKRRPQTEFLLGRGGLQ